MSYNRYHLIILFLFAFNLAAEAQVAQGESTYKTPPKAIQSLIDADLAPQVLFDRTGEKLIYAYKDRYKTIAQLAQPEMRLAGLRLNPELNISSRITYYKDFQIGNVETDKRQSVSGLPDNPQFANFKISPDSRSLAFTNTTDEGVEIWVLDLETAQAKRLTQAKVNANLGYAYVWAPDSQYLLLKVVPESRSKLLDPDLQVPSGPVISVSEGKKALNRTYQDLLESPTDEKNFETLVQSEISKVTLGGEASAFLPQDMYKAIQFSPDGEYLIISILRKPFSYLVPQSRFPYEQIIYDKDGRKIKTINKVPLTEVLPQGFGATRMGMRNLSWRPDKPATLYWVEALDDGDPKKEVAFRDAIYQMDAPFEGGGKLLLKVMNRYSSIIWGNENIAVATDNWFADRNTKTYIFDPSDSSKDPFVLFDRSTQDIYGNPGSFVTTYNNFGKVVLDLSKASAYLMGSGFSEKGQFPFIDKINLENGKVNRLYESDYTDKKETLVRMLDSKEEEILVKVESTEEYPNYYVRNIKNDELRQITHFENPFEVLKNVHKEVIKYNRKDGLELSGTLYLPANYDGKKRLPLLMWAYPTEYKSRAAASQNTSNPNSFTIPSYGSPIFYATQGYAVLDKAAFPIVGEGDKKPNDTFVEQLVANAQAAINALDKRGIIDPDKVAVGGHSYGAFMTANLLAHSDLFAAGIARSGAYNRTLTPFGFQREERTYWDDPKLYYDVSPFMHADKIKTPLLMILGQKDNNAGTFPIQSERLFHAIKGLGGVARLVELPEESHGYSAKESIMHMLWEQFNWLEKHVKKVSD